jgi:hypothetical protein
MANREWIVAQQRRQCGADFDVADGTVDAAIKLIDSIEPRRDLRDVVAHTLFNRLVNGLEAVVTLAERAFITEGLTVFRSMLECAFRLRAICLRPEAIEDYKNQDLLHKARMLEDILQALPAVVTDKLPTRAELEKKLEEHRQAIKDRESGLGHKIKHIDAYTWAVWGNMLEEFHWHYSKVSLPTHHAPRDLDRQLEVDDKTGITIINLGPERESPEDLLHDATGLVHRGAAEFCRYLKIDPPDDLVRLQEALRERYRIRAEGEQQG